MIPILPFHPSTRSGFVARRVAKSLLLLPVIGCVLACTSCEAGDSLPGIEVTADVKPIGEGLKVIGFAVLGASVVVVIGRMLK